MSGRLRRYLSVFLCVFPGTSKGPCSIFFFEASQLIKTGNLEELRQRHCLPSGWWPHVVTGTSRTTLGGCAAMNTHGKNVWHVGPIGEYISSLSLLTPSGDTVNCSSTDNGELFRAAIGGFGMLGIITRLTLQLRSVSSGLVAVNEYAEKNLAATFDRFESAAGGSDFMVAWLDAFARGSRLGRGHIQCAAHVEESEPGSLSVANQELPTRVAGLLPKTWIRHLLQPCWNDTGVRWINEARYRAARVRHGRQSRLPVVWYQFLLDSVPGFERCFGRSGLIQHQVLVPDAHAYDVFEQLIRLQQRKGLVNYLTVMKKHRTDGFLMSYGVDGYSLAQDFRVTRNNRSRLWELCHQMDELVAAAGGRFYLAKDATLLPQHYRASMPPESLEEFFRLKRQLDPDELLQTDLWRRLLRPLRG